ncbi:MAG: signal peptidase II [Brevinema sp.]
MKLKKIEFLLIGLVIFLTGSDLLIKQMITKTFNNMPYPSSESISVIGNFFKLTYVQNFGMTFGLLSNLPRLITGIILTIISITAICVLIYFYKNLQNLLQKKVVFIGKISLSIILGGALGNIIDRIQRGFVVDYLDFGLMDYRWYTFNLADVFIVSGCILLTILLTFFEEKNHSNAD